MSQGSFDLNPLPSGIAVPAAQIIVCSYEPGQENPYTVLPNVRCLRIDYREGAEPSVARFQYYMDDLLQASMGWPSQFEQLWPIDAQGSYVVQNDDRLVVLTQGPPTGTGSPGVPIVLFDGFAQVPQTDVSAQTQAVTFVAQGVAIRLWDSPITGRVQRDASNADDTSGDSDVPVALPCRFNPSDTSIGAQGGYIGNCVASGEYSEVPDSDDTYPVFLDPLVIERGENDTSYWYVSDALAYLFTVEESPEDSGGSPFVIYPTLDSLQALLSCYAPPPGQLLNSGDAVETDIKIRDYDASNKSIADVVAELLRYCGFVMFFATSTDSDGNPQTNLNIIRKDALAVTAPKLLYLAADNATTLDLSANNTTAMHLARDCNQVVNQWTVETALQQVEVTVYLAPGFTPSSADAATPAAREPYLSKNLTNASTDLRRMYRWFIADECGDGHYNMLNSTWVTGTALDLTPIFPPDSDGNYTYVTRYRPGSNTLISKDPDGKPLKAVLEIGQGYYSQDPKFEAPQGSSDFVTIPHGKGWRLLDDRLGIEITQDDPDGWTISSAKPAAGPDITKISTVLWTATPTQATAFFLRLTTVIESDQRIGIPNTSTAEAVTAEKRPASPTQFARERSADGRDHFQRCTLAPGSLYYATQTDINGNSSDGTNPLVMRDDAAAALTHAEQLRSAHEFPTLAGSATLPFITNYYQIGDRVKIIQGRNANLQINVGVNQGETPSYPWVTAFAWDFQGDKQQTILQFSDRRAEPQGV
jgi:hypothetical protein